MIRNMFSRTLRFIPRSGRPSSISTLEWSAPPIASRIFARWSASRSANDFLYSWELGLVREGSGLEDLSSFGDSSGEVGGKWVCRWRGWQVPKKWLVMGGEMRVGKEGIWLCIGILWKRRRAVMGGLFRTTRTNVFMSMT